VSWPDAVLLLTLFCATFVVHDVGYILRAPFWVDETWVAISMKLPVSDLKQVTASSPPGWTLLLRLSNIGGIHLGGEQGARLIPLIFSAFTPPAAYILVRRLPWATVSSARCCAVLCSTAVLLSPTSLVRDDLKQYTADALVSLIILAIVSQMERGDSGRALMALGAVTCLGLLFTNTAVLVGIPGFVALSVTAARRRQRSQLVKVVAVGGVSASIGAAVYYFSRPPVPSGLYDYWHNFFVPLRQGFSASGHFLLHRSGNIADFSTGLPLLLFVVAILAGLHLLTRLVRPALCMTYVLLIIEMIVLSAADKYPYGDQRTSHFLSVALCILAVLGVIHLLELCVDVLREWRPFIRRARPRTTVLATCVAVSLMGAVMSHKIRQHSIPVEDLRTTTRYLAAHERPGDVVLVSSSSTWGVAYYWPKAHVSLRPSTNLQGFIALPADVDMFTANDRTDVAVLDALGTALAEQRRRGAGARLWIVREHLKPAEMQAWQDAFVTDQVAPQAVVGTSLVAVNG